MEPNYNAIAAAYMAGPMGAQILENQLFVAISSMNLAEVQHAVEDGADINRRFSGVTENYIGITPLYFAVRMQFLPIVQYLLSLPTIDVNKPVDFLLPPDAYIYGSAREHGYTPLHLAALFIHIPILTALLQHPDIDKNSINPYGHTPLQLMIDFHPITIHTLPRLLNGVTFMVNQPGIDLNNQSSVGLTAFSLLAQKIPMYTNAEINARLTEVFELMFQKGADIYIRNEGTTIYEAIMASPVVNPHIKAVFEKEHNRRQAEIARRRRVVNVTRSAAVLNRTNLPNNMKKHIKGFLAKPNNVHPENLARLATIKAATNPRLRKTHKMRRNNLV